MTTLPRSESVTHKTKIKVMKLRKRGTLASNDFFNFDKKHCEFFKSFVYFGLVVTSTDNSFADYYVAERLQKVTLVASIIEKPQKFSFIIAVKLFVLSIATSVSYGIPII